MEDLGYSYKQQENKEIESYINKIWNVLCQG